jgi:hypothetical protein
MSQVVYESHLPSPSFYHFFMARCGPLADMGAHHRILPKPDDFGAISRVSVL